MKRMNLGYTLIVAVLFLNGACKSSESGDQPDAAVVAPEPDLAILVPDQNVSPPPDHKVIPDEVVEPPLTALKVAAVQYSYGDYLSVGGCGDDLCGLTHFIQEAKQQGARLVVTAEYTIDQKDSEPSPNVGDKPASDPRWAEGSIIKTLTKLADEQNITLVFNLITDEGDKLHNTSLAVDKEGKVLARHYKFELFGGEKDAYEPGTSIEDSFFDTPAGKAGLLICADVQCIVTDMKTNDLCSKNSVALLSEFFSEKDPDIVILSEMWTVGSGVWAAMTVQKKLAFSGDVYLVAANTTQGAGKGGGIYKPDGEAMQTVKSSKPSVVYGELPLKTVTPQK